MQPRAQFLNLKRPCKHNKLQEPKWRKTRASNKKTPSQFPHYVRVARGFLTYSLDRTVVQPSAPIGVPSQGSFSVNQVEIPFIPFRSTLLPSHTANATGTDAPALNCTSF